MLLLFWAVACLVIMVGTGMGSMSPVTAPDGKRVLLDRSAFDGDIVSVWVPHSRFMYAELPNSSFLTGKYVQTDECTLETGSRPWLLSCQGIRMVVE